MERVTVAGSAPIAAGEAASVTVERIEVDGVVPAAAPEGDAAPTREFERT
jgi:hypothetical protein